MKSLLLLMSIALAACGSDGDPSGTPQLPGEAVCISDTASSAPDFIGLSQSEAHDLATERGLQVREVGRDGECFPVTMDLREDRINLEFIDDVVVGAAIY